MVVGLLCCFANNNTGAKDFPKKAVMNLSFSGQGGFSSEAPVNADKKFVAQSVYNPLKLNGTFLLILQGSLLLYRFLDLQRENTPLDLSCQSLPSCRCPFSLV